MKAEDCTGLWTLDMENAVTGMRTTDSDSAWGGGVLLRERQQQTPLSLTPDTST